MSEKKKIVATYLEAEEKKELEKLARAANRSLSNYVGQLIRDKLNEKKQPTK